MSEAPAEPRGSVGAVAAGVAGLTALCVWFVHQGGLLPAEPGSVTSLAGLVLIALTAALPIGLAWLAAAGYGYLLRQRGVAQLGVGMALLLVVQYVAGFAIGYGIAVVAGVVGSGLFLLVVQGVRQQKSHNKGGRQNGGKYIFWGFRGSWAWLLFAPGVALLLVAACCPPGTMWAVEAFGYDVTSYHLQIPREWIAASGGGAMVELEHNVYAYLPGLMESAYAALMSVHTFFGGETVTAAYTCQLFHASFAVLAALAVVSLLRTRVGDTAAISGGALLLCVPWTVVTGASAYNEQVVVAFTAVGLRLIASKDRPCGRAALAVGLLAGAATLAKLTAAFTVALPLGGLLVWRLIVDVRRDSGLGDPGQSPGLTGGNVWARRVLVPVALCVLVGSAALLPYLARNAAWTGNPVFPFALSVLGEGHWDAARAQRWDAAHMPDAPWGERLVGVWRQAVGNAGYGALGGTPTPAESKNVARFTHEGGVPVLWLAMAGGLAFGIARRDHRWFAAAMGVLLLWQFAWWLIMTHLQSRFLIVAGLPLCLGAALLIEALAKLPGRAGVTGPRLGAAVLGVLLAFAAVMVTWSQSARLNLEDGRSVPAPLYLLVDGLPRPHGSGAMPEPIVNQLPADAKLMVVGNNQSLFYFRPEMVYASAFDASPLTPLLQRTTDPAEVAAALRAAGVTHLWIGTSELDRLHATYGFDAEVTTQAVARLVAGWPHLTPPGPSVLVEVPGAPPVVAPRR